MNNTSVSDRDYARGIDLLSRACNRLLELHTAGGMWTDAADEKAFSCLFDLAKGLDSERLVPVYRLSQPAVFSCMKPTCRPCQRGKFYSCPEAHPAAPAYAVTRTIAVKMIKQGIASPINMNRALRLNFDREIELRGQSLYVTEKILMAYALGKPWARRAIDLGWFPTSAPLCLEQSTADMPQFSLRGSGMAESRL